MLRRDSNLNVDIAMHYGSVPADRQAPPSLCWVDERGSVVRLLATTSRSATHAPRHAASSLSAMSRPDTPTHD